MASQPRDSAREEERRLNILTLAIASVASATAAVVTSQFWIAGTWVAAAVTPVLVALISEILRRPTTAIAERVTRDRTAVLPEAGGAGPPPRERDEALPPRAPADPGGAPVRVYRSGGSQRARSRKKIAVGVVAVTAVLAFAITAVAITGTELITGGSIGKGERKTTFWGGGDKATEDEQETAPQRDDQQKQQQQTEPREEPKPTTPEEKPQQTAPRDEQPQETAPSTTPPETTAPQQP